MAPDAGSPIRKLWSWRDLLVVGAVLVLAGCGASTRAVSHRCASPACQPAVSSVRTGGGGSLRVKRLLRVIASRLHAPQVSSGAPIDFRDREYALEITNAGSPTAYTVATTILQRIRVMPDSSATEHLRVVKPAKFVSRTARLNWIATGSPPLPNGHHAAYRWSVPSGSFSFTPQGAPMTYGQVRDLPSSPAALAQKFRRLLDARADPSPAEALLRQYGFVLAVAPLPQPVRRAILRAMAMLPGLSLCGGAVTNAEVHAIALCMRGNTTRTEVVLDTHEGVALAVRERLEAPAIFYPNIQIGALVDSDTFSSAPNHPAQ